MKSGTRSDRILSKMSIAQFWCLGETILISSSIILIAKLFKMILGTIAGTLSF